ncbi:damage-inducible protein DinB [Loktanella sp. D2R18]|uniref:DinB family protein n=1 Tax=Rhodobacterales TaxID=204455 RepID=UPI000DE9D638|nr:MULTISPECIES: DinB family protein [Rhodobacterales]MDO6590762.1 DinB family protein [Yoonia sp. 1_MG-2023]RBW44622.1 damage-inducible protein DinB [Loktanella sp. D2R18]
MITVDYCRTMAAYNRWQNDGQRRIVTAMTSEALTLDRGAFFGSIVGTLNHLLWGDTLWMSRFDGGQGTDITIPHSVALTGDVNIWDAKRAQMDDRISTWARALQPADLEGDLHWYSGSMQRDFAKPVAICVMHFFHHQTHHRGQIHAMLTAAGEKPGDTDLPFLPQN